MEDIPLLLPKLKINNSGIPNLKLNNSEIERSEGLKLLGVLLDENLC